MHLHPRKSSKVRKTFLSIMKVFSIAGLTTFLLMIIATTDGVGYEVSSDLISRTYLEESDPVRAQWAVLYVVELNLSCNQFLYPISYVTETGQISGTFKIVYYPRMLVQNAPFIPSSADIEKQIAGKLAFLEMQKNLPYFFIVGLIIGYAVAKTALIIRRKVVDTYLLDRPEMR